MKLFVLLLSIVFFAPAMDYSVIREFITSSVTEDNAHYLGFSYEEKLQDITFGNPLPVMDIDAELLRSYPATNFATVSNNSYLPVILDGRVRCFVTVSSNGEPLSLGSKKLAEELNGICENYTTEIDNITLYSSTQINSYLFSVPVKQRGETENLTILEPGWSRGRSGLSSKSETLKELLAVVERGL